MPFQHITAHLGAPRQPVGVWGEEAAVARACWEEGSPNKPKPKQPGGRIHGLTLYPPWPALIGQMGREGQGHRGRPACTTCKTLLLCQRNYTAPFLTRLFYKFSLLNGHYTAVTILTNAIEAIGLLRHKMENIRKRKYPIL